MSKITGLGDKIYSPIMVANEVPWDDLAGVIVLATTKDGEDYLWCSDMKWEKMSYLKDHLTANLMRRMIFPPGRK